jgi:hypothetical protein
MIRCAAAFTTVPSTALLLGLELLALALVRSPLGLNSLIANGGAGHDA